MDQEADYENFEEEHDLGDYSEEQITVAPPWKVPLQNITWYRLLNSLLISLITIIVFFVAMWNIVVYVAAAGGRF